MIKYLRFFTSKLKNKNSNMRSHFRYVKNKLFEKNIFLQDEVIFGKGSLLKSYKDARISVGDQLILRDNTQIVAITGKIQIGDCVFFNRNCNLYCRNSIVIGDSVMFGPNVILWDHDHLFDENNVYGTEYRTGEIVIEKGCWIGAGAIILRNTRIGEGSVIGAGTVVKGDIPPHSLVTMNRELLIRPILNK